MISNSRVIKSRYSNGTRSSIIYNTIPLIAVAIIIIYWVPIIWQKYFSLHDYVFDLGVFYGSLHSIFYIHSPTILYQYAAGSTLRIVLSPLSAFNSMLLLLYLQLVLVFGTAITVYLISRKVFSGHLAPLLMSMAYLLYFPTNGSIFFDVHAQTFFLPFFLLAYYFQISGRYRFAFLFFMLAGLSRFPIIGIIVLYSILDFIYNFRLFRKTGDSVKFRKVIRFDYVLFAVSFAITAIQYYANTYVFGVSALGNIHAASAVSLSGLPLGTDMITVLVFAAPLMLLPLFYSEFSLILWALFGFAFYTNYGAYLYPSVFTDQYSALFVPLIFISVFAGVMARRANSVSESPAETSRQRIDPHLKTAIKIFVAIAIFAILFQPYSPVAVHTNGSLSISNYTAAGPVNEAELQSVINLIPTSATGIVFGGNMPEIMVHSPDVNGTLVSDTINGYPLAWTPQYIAETSSVQYVTGVPSDFSTGPAVDSYSQYQLTQNAMSSGAFGVVAEYHGAFLIERGYVGSPVLFSPMHYSTVSYRQMFALNSSAAISGGLEISDAVNATVIPSTTFLFYPGTYSVQLNISGVSLANPADIQFRLSASNVPGNLILASSQIMDGQSSVTVNFTLHNFYANAELFMTGLNFQGSMSLQSMNIRQTGA